MELSAQGEPIPAWREIRADLRRAVGDTTYEIWLSSLQPKAWDGQVLVLGCPAATQAWIDKRYRRILERSTKAILGDGTRVELDTGARTAAQSRSGATAPAPAPEAASALNPRYSFEQFIIGDGNRLAHAASLAVAELPGQAYNPLFVHAPPGLGKTHLLHAIGNYVLAFGGGATVRYTTVEAFTNHFITAINSRSVDRFKQAYRDADVLLIDDVQFLASKAKTEEEFFHTFNALYETGRQLVLTCDRLPRRLLSVEERLRERFESGLVADIRPPDFATRVAILRKRVQLDHIELTDSRVLELIAERVTDNIRTLEGALIRTVAHHSLTGRPLDLELADEILQGMDPRPAGGELSIRRIQTTVASSYEITVEELLSPSRTARINWPRQVAIHLARELTENSLNAIGEAFGGRNHATVLHACKRVSERLLSDPHTAGELDGLVRSLSPPNTDRGC